MNPNVVEIINQTYLTKRRRNSSYSYRAFARDLGISQSLLMKVLDGSRNVTAELAIRVGLHLQLSSDQILALAISAIKNK